MKPRIFVSSTYYDLKYIRNNLETFIEQYGFEPVLFESGKVTFSHDQQLDESCYDEVKLCHIMILIIGGRYGSPASNEKLQQEISDYEKGYISITRKEFKTATDNNIPIFIFIDKNVYAEYLTFKENESFFLNLSKQQDKDQFKFAHVDSVNIFRFIDEVKVKAVQSFEKFEHIERYLKSQWSGMFYLYLRDLQNKNKKDTILDSVTELKNVTDRMNEMLNEVGKKILGDNGEYEKVIQTQNVILIKFFVDKVFSNIVFEDGHFEIKEEYKLVSKYIIEDFLENTELKSAWTKYKQKKISYDDYKKTLILTFNNLKEKILKIKNTTKESVVIVKEISSYEILPTYYDEIQPIIEKESSLKDTFVDYLAKIIEDNSIFF